MSVLGTELCQFCGNPPTGRSSALGVSGLGTCEQGLDDLGHALVVDRGHTKSDAASTRSCAFATATA